MGTFIGTSHRTFITTGHADPRGAPISEYVTNGVSYYFIEEISRPTTDTVAEPNTFEWQPGDGVWTTLDFTNLAVGVADVNAANMANLIG